MFSTKCCADFSSTPTHQAQSSHSSNRDLDIILKNLSQELVLIYKLTGNQADTWITARMQWAIAGRVG